MLVVRGSRVTISCGFKVEFCLTKWFHGVFAWSDYSADKCTIRITDEMDMTPLQVSCWRGKFLRRTQEWYSFNYYLYMMEQSALRTWVWHSCAPTHPPHPQKKQQSRQCLNWCTLILILMRPVACMIPFHCLNTTKTIILTTIWFKHS